jgi:hypothetical protein
LTECESSESHRAEVHVYTCIGISVRWQWTPRTLKPGIHDDLGSFPVMDPIDGFDQPEECGKRRFVLKKLGKLLS